MLWTHYHSFQQHQLAETKVKMNNKLTGLVELESLTPANSKPIIDEIDRALARHYGLSDEELDFIINYDVKYRMGAEAGQTSEFLENSEV